FQAFLEGDDIPDRVDLGFLDPKGAREEKKHRMQLRKALDTFLGAKSPEETFRACLKFLGKSDASIVLVNLEDLWQDTKPQNIPATTAKQRPNWRRPLRRSVEELAKDKEFRTVLEDLDRSRKKQLQ